MNVTNLFLLCRTESGMKNISFLTKQDTRSVAYKPYERYKLFLLLFFLVFILHRVLKALDALSELGPYLGKAACSKEQQRDDQDDNQFRESYVAHFFPRLTRKYFLLITQIGANASKCCHHYFERFKRQKVQYKRR